MDQMVSKDELQVLTESLFNNPLFGDSFLYLTDIFSRALPPPAVINKLLYKLLLEDVAVNFESVSIFLQNVLIAFQSKVPCEFNYKAAIFNPSDSFYSLWSILAHLVKSSFSFHGVALQSSSSQLDHFVQHPTCDALLHFYVEYILNYLSLKRDLFEHFYCERCTELMRWINALYKFHKYHVDISKDLHRLLDHSVNSEVMLDSAFTSSAALNQASLSESVKKILTLCEDCFTDGSKLINFLNHCTFEHVSTSICYHLLCSLTRKENILTEQTPLTLKELVCHFFFVSLSEKDEEMNIFPTRKKNFCPQNSKEKVKKASVECLSHGDQKLHIMCRKNQFGDLFELLSSTKSKRINLNGRNKAKQTPLHVACISSNHLCVKILLNSAHGKADVGAVDALSCNPLHYAVIANDVETVKILIEYGGEKLLLEEDCYKLTPYDYARSSKMIQTLDAFFPTNEIYCFGSQHFEVSVIEKQNYSLYLTTLHSLLCLYFKMFDLFRFQLDFDVVEHNQSSCAHFLKHASRTLCVEDYSVLFFIPQLISDMIKRIRIDAAEKDVNVEKEIQLLYIFSTSC